MHMLVYNQGRSGSLFGGHLVVLVCFDTSLHSFSLFACVVLPLYLHACVCAGTSLSAAIAARARTRGDGIRLQLLISCLIRLGYLLSRVRTLRLQIENCPARRINCHCRSRSVGMHAENLSLQMQILSLESQLISITDVGLKTDQFCNHCGYNSMLAPAGFELGHTCLRKVHQAAYIGHLKHKTVMAILGGMSGPVSRRPSLLQRV